MKIILLLIISLAPLQLYSHPTWNNKKSDIKSNNDTTLTINRIEILNKSFDILVTKLLDKENDKSSIWNILIPLLIGASLTLFTQLMVELWRTKKDNITKKQQLISRGQAKTYLIAQILKDLAMYKVHKQYYARAFHIDNDNDDFKKHYEKGQQQRETESKLDDNIADYFQLVTEYSILTKNIDRFREYFSSIFEFEHPKSSKFSEINSSSELEEGLKEEEKRLNKEYKKLIAIFESIQMAMK